VNGAVAAPSGILLVDKAGEWTSHDVVARTRRLAGTRKVGHAGTLDPMATGLLVLGLGSSTRLLGYVVGADKEYRATIRLGAASTTDDADGEILEHATSAALAALTTDGVREGIAQLTGDIEQVPSSVSAIKVEGKRAYARVRAGEDVVLSARPVAISAFELLGYEAVQGDGHAPNWLDLMVRVECSSGTYIRALARDLGASLGVGGHLTALRRTRVGPFGIENAATLDELTEGGVLDRLIDPADAARKLFPAIELTRQETIDLGHGKRIRPAEPPTVTGPVAGLSPSGRLVGLIEFRDGQGRTLLGFPSAEVDGGAVVDAADEEAR
jgi:tRNA pseudouridine55 synthase